MILIYRLSCYAKAFWLQACACVCDPDIFRLTPANLMKGEGSPTGVTRLVKHSRWNAQHAQFNNTRDEPVDYYGTIDHRTVANEAIPKRGKIVFTNVPSAEKVPFFFSRLSVHFCCMSLLLYEM